MKSNKIKIAIVGLGYVGLPLAVKFGTSKLKPVIGFDVDVDKIKQLKKGIDDTGEVIPDELKTSDIEFSDDQKILKKANFIITAVPTPITKAKKPDLALIKEVSKTIGQNLSKDSIVVFESTVYPGVTEDICVPIIERESGLKCGQDWKIAYSPERTNPGDKERTIDKITKIVSGMDQETLNVVADTYSEIIKAGVHKAPTIKTAEAAKVIENVQRDLNIALANELSIIFEKIGINTEDVMEAAGTKWNFQKYKPGLVGGHCIGVDPYYLTYRAEELGHHPEVILAGRRINDHMPKRVAELVIKSLIEGGKTIKGSKVLVMGLTFKENVKDIRNSKAKEVIKQLQEYKVEVLGHDPLLDEEEINGFGVKNISDINKLSPVDGIVICCIHDKFKNLGEQDFNKLLTDQGLLFDLKSHFKNLDKSSHFIYMCL